MAGKLQELVSEAWKEVLKRFNSPMLTAEPIAVDDEINTTAHFDFKDNSIKYNPEFVHTLVNLGLDAKTALIGLWTHEVSHYVDNPHDIARLLVQSEAVDSYFSKEDADIKHALLNLYLDSACNLERMRRERDGKELRAMNKALTKDTKTSEVFKLLSHFYADRCQFYKEDSEPSADFKQRIEKLRKVDFFNEELEGAYIAQFGEIILDMLKKEKEKYKGQSGKSGSGQGGKGSLTPIDDSFDDKLKDVSDSQLEDALNKIARDKGLNHYERIKRFLKKKTGKELGKFRADPRKSTIAGLESSDITWNNDLIDYYKRKSIGRVYIHKKPLIIDSYEAYPFDSNKFSVSDEFAKLNPFSTPKIMPGITQKHKMHDGMRKDKKFTYPDLFISLDSSGSMRDPRSLSQAVLAGFMLAVNYHRNDSRVGVMNFSADSAILFPTRQIDDVYSMLCAYWGGGTVYDTEKIDDFIKTMKIKGELEKIGLKGVQISNEKDYKSLLARLDPETRKRFEKKELYVTPKKAKEQYEKIDHVMITDGGIANIEEVVNYFNRTAQQTRNTIVVVGNKGCFDEWQKKGMENTQVIYAEEAGMLPDLVIGKVKTMPPKDKELNYFD